MTFPKELKKHFVIQSLLKYFLVSHPTVHDMIIGKRKFYSEWTGHVHTLQNSNTIVNSRFDPFTNLKRANAPGNVLLSKGEAHLKKASVVNISQVVTVDKADLIEKIGTLSLPRVNQIIEGIQLLIKPRELSE